MNTELFYYSIAEIGISIIIGVLLLFVTYKLIDRLVRRKYNIKLDNISFSIFGTAFKRLGILKELSIELITKAIKFKHSISLV